MNTQATLKAACELLEKQGHRVSFEYPGWISFGALAFGDASGAGYGWNGERGEAHGPHEERELPAEASVEELAGWIVGEMKGQLARVFCRVLREWLTVEQLKTVVVRNRLELDSNVCHTHDFCDANMAMHAAFEQVLKIDAASEEFLNDEPKMALWNGSWTLAKVKEFAL